MEWFFSTHRKFSWQSCTVCGGLAIFLGIVVGYGAIGIADATAETRAGEQNFVERSISRWNMSLPLFEDFQFSVQFGASSQFLPLQRNESDDYHIRGWPLAAYQHMKFSADFAPFADSSAIRNESSADLLATFNLTTNLTIAYRRKNDYAESYSNFERIVLFRRDFSRLNKKMCEMHEQGVWDLYTQACYQYQVLSDLCFVFNLSSQRVAAGCRGSYEQWERFDWETMEPPRNLTEIVNVTVRANTDPCFVDAQLKAISNAQMEKIIVGALLIVIGCLFFLVPIIYFWQVLRSRSDNLLEKRTFESPQAREGYIPRY